MTSTPDLVGSDAPRRTLSRERRGPRGGRRPTLGVLVPMAIGAVSTLLGCPPRHPAVVARDAAEPRASGTSASLASAGSSDLPGVASASGATVAWFPFACATDADCVPEAACHPSRCVNPGEAGVLEPGTMCSQVCVPDTLDCGQAKCGCRRGDNGRARCARVATSR